MRSLIEEHDESVGEHVNSMLLAVLASKAGLKPFNQLTASLLIPNRYSYLISMAFSGRFQHVWMARMYHAHGAEPVIKFIHAIDHR